MKFWHLVPLCYEYTRDPGTLGSDATRQQENPGEQDLLCISLVTLGATTGRSYANRLCHVTRRRDGAPGYLVQPTTRQRDCLAGDP
jgi:hypothetical protein